MNSEDELRERLLRVLQDRQDESACRECMDQIEAYVAAQLAGEAYLELYPDVALHLDACRECAVAYALSYETELALRENRVDWPVDVPAPDLSFLRDTSSVRASAGRDWRMLLRQLDPRSWLNRPVWQPALALTVVAVVVVAAVLLVSNPSGEIADIETPTPTVDVQEEGAGNPTLTAEPSTTPTEEVIVEQPDPTVTSGTEEGGIVPAEFPTLTPDESVTPECSEPVRDVFSAAYANSESQLGCPTGAALESLVVIQQFENGQMFHLVDEGSMFVLFESGIWLTRDVTWRETDPLYMCGPTETPPTPRREFGQVWCADEAIRTALGSATTLESTAQGVVQFFEGGVLLLVAGEPLTLLGDERR